ncbi:ABC transporter ATP-binding protein [Pelagibacterium halotolerans]|nr:ABC transporter ATP-binding protein [Pelagibacterium halotolerans]QJR18864.1 ABC transporter ATP-binding protein [Pelagibacterium halotolerans]
MNQQRKENVLTVENLTTTFTVAKRNVDVVRDVSFTVGQGRVMGLVGESGSGKSVTARSILRLLRKPGRVTAGRVLLNGINLLDLPEGDMRAVRGRDIAMVFQDPQSALNPVMRVGDQITEALLVHGVDQSKARERAKELLAQVRIPDVERAIDQYPHEFSGGMRQRVVIAIALANKPRLLIADEPTTALDVTIQAQILRLLVDLREELGVAIILITHDMGVVAELCDDLAVMYGGRIVEKGSVARVLKHPTHPYTAALLRAVPRLDSEEHEALPAIPGQPPIPVQLPPGCSFQPRCSKCIDICDKQVPALEEIEPGQHSACWVAQRGERDLAPPRPTSRSRIKASRASAVPVLKITDLRTDVADRKSRLFSRHKPVYAVDGISLEIYPGQTYGLVGESGCGKSSLSRTIVGIHAASSGSIEVAGRDVTAMTAEDRRHVTSSVQYVFQDPSAALNPRRTIGQSIEEALVVAGHTGQEADKRASGLMERVGLSPQLLRRYPYEISGGQRQRVGIARALAVDPKVLVLDEPVSALDVSIQAQIINLLDELRNDLGLAYLFIAHDLSVVKHISDRVAVMYLGRIVEAGTTDEVYGNPRHPYTQALLSATPEPDVDRDRSHRIYLSGDMPSPASPPSGCRFRTRCPVGPRFIPERTICISQSPKLEPALSGQKCACHFRNDPARINVRADPALA